MDKLLKLEEIGQFLLSIALFSLLDYQWWIFLLLIFLPDISMVGYLFNTKIGAILYNIFHHKFIGISLMIVGYFGKMDLITLAGIILFGHAAMDRIFNYGLKFNDSFHHTHLGWIGGKTKPQK